MAAIEINDPAPVRANARSLKKVYDQLPGTPGSADREGAFARHLSESVQRHDDNGRWAPRLDVSAVRLEEAGRAFLGPDWQRALLESLRSGRAVTLMEAGAPVSTVAFANIIGQLIYSAIHQGYDAEEFVFGRLIPVMQSRIKGTEKVPGVTPIGEQSAVVGEAQGYTSVQFGEETYTLPEAVKRGFMVELTEEAIFFDLTGLVVKRASEVGKWLGLKREIDICDLIIGATNNYIRNGSATNTYLTTGAYVNNASSVELVDWTDVEAAMLLGKAIMDPTTGYPTSLFNPKHLVTMPAKHFTARRILSATEVRSGDITSGAGHQTVSASPLNGGLMALTSQLLKERVLDGPESEEAKANNGWFLGDLGAAFGFKEIWPLAVLQQGADSNAGFEKDVVLRYKARYFGVPFVKEPRAIVRMESDAWA